MRAPPIPGNERDRLRTLASYDVLDTLPEEAFDRITRLVARLLRSRLAVINFVDERRQWGKSCVGTASTEASREVSFCAWTILRDTPLIVPDTHADERFVGNPMVTGDPFIHAYMGVPLVAPDGHRLGSLCVTWETPHEPQEYEINVLRECAAMTMDELELRRRTRELEQQVRVNSELMGQLKRTNNELDAFTRSVSHDLRTPVRHIRGFTNLLVRAADKGDLAGVSRYAGVVDDAARRMSDLIDDLLEFSRLVDQPLRVQPVALGELVAEVRASLESDLQDRHITWHVGELPIVQGDPSLLRQVLANLLGNAVKYTSRVPQALIEVFGQSDGEEDVVHVRDNGAGFDSRYAERLFQVFQRLHRADEFEGTGVGLATVQRVVHRHGGRVWAQGEVGQGATFSFSLPKPRVTTETT